MARIRLADVTVTLGEASPPALDGISLDIADGEFLVLAGPSGSGKTTALRTIAGLQQPTSGRVLFDEEDRTGDPAQERDVAMVFQDYGLYPHKSAGANIRFPLEAIGVKPEAERVTRAHAEAVHLRIEHLMDRYPGQLAAGQRQAVATARSLVRRTGVLLMDEPLAHLDAKARRHARVEVQRLHRDVGSTIVYVTNEQSEAMSLGDRVAILDEGRIRQVGRPMDVFTDPVDTMVATFLGTPSMALLPAEITVGGDGLDVMVGTDRLRLPPSEGLEPWVGRPITLGVRPHHLRIGREDAPFRECLHGTVTVTEDHGDEAFAVVDLGVAGAGVTVTVPAPPVLAAEAKVEMAVSVDAIRFFDPATGLAV